MGRAVTLAGCLFLGAALSAQRSQAARETTHDFGKVRQGEVVSHEFRILNPKNEGPARVARVDLDGPGMTARFRPAVGPGEFVTIRVTWDTSKVDGKVEARGTVRWADPKRPPVTLQLTGEVVPSIQILPMAAVFFSVFADEKPEQVIQIINHEQRPLQVTRFEAAGSHFTADLREVQAGQRFDLRVTAVPGGVPGRFQERLIVHTDSPARPFINVAVNVFVKADVYANPETVDFGDVSLAAVRQRPTLLALHTQKFLLRRRQGPFEIRSATTDVPGLVIHVSPGAQAAHEVTVSLAPDKLAPRVLGGSIRLATSDARFPEIVVPVRGRLR